MKMTAKELMNLLEDVNENIKNITALQASTEWDAKDKLCDSVNVNKPFNNICQISVKQLTLLKTILQMQLDNTEVHIYDEM